MNKIKIVKRHFVPGYRFTLDYWKNSRVYVISQFPEEKDPVMMTGTDRSINLGADITEENAIKVFDKFVVSKEACEKII